MLPLLYFSGIQIFSSVLCPCIVFHSGLILIWNKYFIRFWSELLSLCWKLPMLFACLKFVGRKMPGWSSNEYSRCDTIVLRWSRCLHSARRKCGKHVSCRAGVHRIVHFLREQWCCQISAGVCGASVVSFANYFSAWIVVEIQNYVMDSNIKILPCQQSS